jgi:hypothetical protein
MNLKVTLLIIFSVFITACSTDSKIDAEKEFEKLYIALDMPAIIESLENIEINNKEMVEKHFSNIPPEVREFLAAAMGPNQVITDSINKQAVKKVFKLKIMELLTPAEIANAAKFYSNKSGLKAHQAIVEAEKSVTEYLDGE